MSTQTIASQLETPTNMNTEALSITRIWTGRILSGLAVAFFLMDSIMKLFKPPFVVQATVQLGYPESTIVGIGIALLVSTLVYIVPRTSVLGAILLTGYLGGAIASGVRIQAPLFNIVFPFVFAVVVWAGLVLRSRRVADVLLFTKP
jgi:hypothetical protein